MTDHRDDPFQSDQSQPDQSQPGQFQSGQLQPDPTVTEPIETDDAVAEFKRAIESIVLVAHDPVPAELLAQLLEEPTVMIGQWCDELAESYRAARHGFELVHIAGGWRFQTAADLTPYVERFLLHDQRARLSGAALETLAIVAYKQPISRGQIASIRGVDPDGVMRTLQARGYIDEVGRDQGPGQAILFGTTGVFLEKLGLATLDDLPPIAEFIPGADVIEALEIGLRVTPLIEVSANGSSAHLGDGELHVGTEHGAGADSGSGVAPEPGDPES